MRPLRTPILRADQSRRDGDRVCYVRPWATSSAHGGEAKGLGPRSGERHSSRPIDRGGQFKPGGGRSEGECLRQRRTLTRGAAAPAVQGSRSSEQGGKSILGEVTLDVGIGIEDVNPPAEMHRTVHERRDVDVGGSAVGDDRCRHDRFHGCVDIDRAAGRGSVGMNDEHGDAAGGSVVRVVLRQGAGADDRENGDDGQPPGRNQPLDTCRCLVD